MKIVTSGAAYLDIDAYACMVAYAELLNKQGSCARAVSKAQFNNSISKSVRGWGKLIERDYQPGPNDVFVLVDVSDRAHFDSFVPNDPNRISEIIDHHPGFEEYWCKTIGDRAEIRHIGAAATQIYARFKRAGIKPSKLCANLLLTAILDNTLNFTLQITQAEDKKAYRELFLLAELDNNWIETYFLECQEELIQGLPRSLELDTKVVRFAGLDHDIRVAQAIAWEPKKFDDLHDKLYEALGIHDSQMGFINLIDVHNNRSYILSQNVLVHTWIESLFGVTFVGDRAVLEPAHLRKEITQRAIDKLLIQ